MNLTAEQKQLGRDNFQAALGFTRRDFLKTAAVGPAAGAFYFGYRKIDGRPVRAGIIGCGDEGNVLITESNPDYLEFMAYSDIRPSNRKRTMEGENNPVRIGFKRKYGNEAAAAIERRSETYHDDYHRLLADPDVEMVVIALPLHLHAPVAIAAMKAGKHVLCEKLMARTIAQCKEMIRVSKAERKLLTIGHQRHYSLLYANAVEVVKSGVLGDLRFIRALWHRNNTWPVFKKDRSGKPLFDERGYPIPEHDGELPKLVDSWRKDIPPDDLSVDVEKHQYKSIEELVRWRLYQRTGAGLMAELGSHQLDACSIFLGKKHPLAVSGVGVKSFYRDDREIDDHIFVTFEFPGEGYFEPGTHNVRDQNDLTVVTYSSINTNAFEPYGETIYGSRGTMMVESERDVMLFKESAPGGTPSRATAVKVVEDTARKPVLDASPTAGGAPQAAAAVASGQMSKGYREEMEHLASCIRRFSPDQYDDLTKELRCNGTVAMADAIVAMVANQSMAQRQRILFQPEWFDPESPAVPEKQAGVVGAGG
jgi:predicted dehydrogenase